MMAQSIFLSPPAVQYKDSFIAAMREFHREGRNPDWNFESLEAHFEEYVVVQLAREHDPLPGRVPQTDYWLIVDNIYAGRISIRHHLNSSLEKFGGHIGYDIRPSMRHKGYGTLQCRLALAKARERGLERVLITCDDDNIGSQKIIEANGGVLLDKVDNGRPTLTRRYWIDLRVT